MERPSPRMVPLQRRRQEASSKGVQSRGSQSPSRPPRPPGCSARLPARSYAQDHCMIRRQRRPGQSRRLCGSRAAAAGQLHQYECARLSLLCPLAYPCCACSAAAAAAVRPVLAAICSRSVASWRCVQSSRFSASSRASSWALASEAAAVQLFSRMTDRPCASSSAASEAAAACLASSSSGCAAWRDASWPARPRASCCAALSAALSARCLPCSASDSCRDDR